MYDRRQVRHRHLTARGKAKSVIYSAEGVWGFHFSLAGGDGGADSGAKRPEVLGFRRQGHGRIHPLDGCPENLRCFGTLGAKRVKYRNMSTTIAA